MERTAGVQAAVSQTTGAHRRFYTNAKLDTPKETPIDPDVCPADFWPRHWENCGLAWRFEKVVREQGGRRARRVVFDFSVGMASTSHSDTRRPPDAVTVRTKSDLRGFRFSCVYDDPNEKTVYITLKIPEKINKIQYVLCDATYSVRDEAAVQAAIRELYINAVIE